MGSSAESSATKWLLGIVIAIFVVGVGYYLSELWNDQLVKDRANFEERRAEIARLDEKQRELAAQIKKWAGKNECQTDSDCQIIGVGQKVCGGYLNFLIYSTRFAKEDDLLEGVKEFNKNQTRLNDLNFKVPNCGKQVPPTHCEKAACVAGG